METPESVHLSVNEGYNRWAAFYDQDDIPLNLLEEAVVDTALGEVKNLKIVDLACGTGRQTIRLANKGASVIGVDQSEGMLEKAQQKNSDAFFMHANLEEEFPFPDAAFDRVVSFLALEHITNLKFFFTECKRVCKPDGFIYFTAMHPAMLLKGVQARFTDAETGKKIYPKGFPHKISDYVNAIAQSGLKLVEMTEHATDETHNSERANKYMGWPLLLTLKCLPN